MTTQTTVTTTEYDQEGRICKMTTVVTDEPPAAESKPMLRPVERKSAVIAGNWEQAQVFMRTVAPEHRKNYVIAATSASLRGHRLKEILTYGTWWARRDMDEVLAAAQVGML